MQLAPNFSLAELVKSDWALRHHVPNTPDSREIANLTRVAVECLQPLHEKFGAVLVHSGFRCPQVNRGIGGSATSAHVHGLAADIECPGIPNATVAQWLADHVPFDQIILEFYTPGQPNSGWVHIGLADKLRRQKLTAARISGRTQYIPGFHP